MLVAQPLCHLMVTSNDYVRRHNSNSLMNLETVVVAADMLTPMVFVGIVLQLCAHCESDGNTLVMDVVLLLLLQKQWTLMQKQI